MSEKIRAITLGYVKYSDTSIILHVYTVEYGYLSLMIKGFFAKKKKMQACLYPFTEVEFILDGRSDRGKLIKIYSLDNVVYYDGIYTNPIKNLQIQFVAEVMMGILKQEPGNIELYTKIKQELKLLNEKKSDFAEFHLFFIKNISQYLGLKPDVSTIEGEYFNVKDGTFTMKKEQEFNVDREASYLLKSLFENEFDLFSQNRFTHKQRNILLDVLLKYYEYHIPNFIFPRSLEIIKVLLA